MLRAKKRDRIDSHTTFGELPHFLIDDGGKKSIYIRVQNWDAYAHFLIVHEDGKYEGRSYVANEEIGLYFHNNNHLIPYHCAIENIDVDYR